VAFDASFSFAMIFIHAASFVLKSMNFGVLKPAQYSILVMIS